jgi:DNA-binding response OmpR family regulator
MKEFDLLLFLARNPGRVYSRDNLLDYVWGQDSFVGARTVDVHIRRLREQIEQDASQPEYIKTVWGVGYKFTDE